MKHLHLLVAGLDAGTDSPALAKLLARGRRMEAPEDAGYSAALARLFGVDTDNLAAIALAAEGVDPGAGAWFQADPVHLLAGMHSLTLFDRRHLHLQADESVALVAALNHHFAGEIEFLAPHPERWYARFRQTPRVEIPPLDQVAGGTIAPGLFAGPDARDLQRAVMEIQMLLHGHPVNAARETRGAATVNSLWIWGGGTYRQPKAACSKLYGGDFAVRSLARAAGIGHADLPGRFEPAAIEHAALVALPAPASLPAVDTLWFRPVLAGLQRRRISRLELTLPGRNGLRLHLDGWGALAFWRDRRAATPG